MTQSGMELVRQKMADRAGRMGRNSVGLSWWLNFGTKYACKVVILDSEFLGFRGPRSCPSWKLTVRHDSGEIEPIVVYQLPQ
jgi:hypothetical protein